MLIDTLKDKIILKTWLNDLRIKCKNIPNDNKYTQVQKEKTERLKLSRRKISPDLDLAYKVREPTKC